MQDLRLEHLMPAYVNVITQLGVKLEFGNDFGTLDQICKTIPEKHGVGPAFDQQEISPRPIDGVWMIGRRGTEIVHTQAIKKLDLARTTLERHLAHHSADFRIGGLDIDVPNSTWNLTHAAREISGTITYHGELWLKGGPDGIRGGCLSTLLTRLMLMIAFQKWSPDYFIGIQAAGTSCRGLATREGYMRTEQRSIFWKRRDGLDPIEGWLVWMNRDEAYHNLSTTAWHIYDMLEPADKRAIHERSIPQVA